MYNYILVIASALCFVIAEGQLERDPMKLLNWCLDGINHKNEPGPEGELFKQCSPWKNRSCCTHDTTRHAHNSGLYGFTYDHCGAVKIMSPLCRKHFMQDLCFYECSPNIGPWVVKVDNMKIRKERFFEVPLCQSDCDAWFESCSEDYTCTDNWSRNFVWRGKRNHCPEGSKCRTFAEVYETAENFCSKVWDHSWKPVPDEEPCMRLWFNGNYGNPNEKVAALYASRLAAKKSNAHNIYARSLHLAFVLTFLVIVL